MEKEKMTNTITGSSDMCEVPEGIDTRPTKEKKEKKEKNTSSKGVIKNRINSFKTTSRYSSDKIKLIGFKKINRFKTSYVVTLK